MKVYVVTGLELGWDCVVGVFNASIVPIEELQELFPKGEYHIFSKDVEDETEMWL